MNTLSLKQLLLLIQLLTVSADEYDQRSLKVSVLPKNKTNKHKGYRYQVLYEHNEI